MIDSESISSRLAMRLSTFKYKKEEEMKSMNQNIDIRDASRR